MELRVVFSSCPLELKSYVFNDLSLIGIFKEYVYSLSSLCNISILGNLYVFSDCNLQGLIITYIHYVKCGENQSWCHSYNNIVIFWILLGWEILFPDISTGTIITVALVVFAVIVITICVTIGIYCCMKKRR